MPTPIRPRLILAIIARNTVRQAKTISTTIKAIKAINIIEATHKSEAIRPIEEMKQEIIREQQHTTNARIIRQGRVGMDLSGQKHSRGIKNR